MRSARPPAMTLIKPVAFIVALSAAIILIGSWVCYLADSTDCERYNYNDRLNGGVKDFKDKKYTINICGSGVNNSRFFGDGMDVVQLTIADEQGTVLAKRRYKVFWEGIPGHEPITVGKDAITYQDDEKQRDYTIAMPPSAMEWIRARLPLMN